MEIRFSISLRVLSVAAVIGAGVLARPGIALADERDTMRILGGLAALGLIVRALGKEDERPGAGRRPLDDRYLDSDAYALDRFTLPPRQPNYEDDNLWNGREADRRNGRKIGYKYRRQTGHPPVISPNH